jgi:hypothetical protein
VVGEQLTRILHIKTSIRLAQSLAPLRIVRRVMSLLLPSRARRPLLESQAVFLELLLQSQGKFQLLPAVRVGRIPSLRQRRLYLHLSSIFLSLFSGTTSPTHGISISMERSTTMLTKVRSSMSTSVVIRALISTLAVTPLGTSMSQGTQPLTIITIIPTARTALFPQTLQVLSMSPIRSSQNVTTNVSSFKCSPHSQKTY